MSADLSDFERGYADGEKNQASDEDKPSAQEMSGHPQDYRLGYVTGWVSAFAAGVAGDMGRLYGVPAKALLQQLSLTSQEHVQMVMDDYKYDGE
jgi:hypothetical protein